MMRRRNTSRSATRLLLRAGAGLCLLVSPGVVPACGASAILSASSAGRALQQQAPAPIERRPPPSTVPVETRPEPQISGQRAPGKHGPQGMHIAEWMSQHNNLNPDEQQQALQREPGFQSLPQPTQQRMRDRLTQLNAMNPERRQRLLARNEAMERLTPDQRADVRGAMGQLGSLPLDQRRNVARTFRALRDLPPNQRVAALNSGRYGTPTNDEQRNVLDHLLRVEPMLPPPSNVPGVNGAGSR